VVSCRNRGNKPKTKRPSQKQKRKTDKIEIAIITKLKKKKYTKVEEKKKNCIEKLKKKQKTELRRKIKEKEKNYIEKLKKKKTREKKQIDRNSIAMSLTKTCVTFAGVLNAGFLPGDLPMEAGRPVKSVTHVGALRMCPDYNKEGHKNCSSCNPNGNGDSESQAQPPLDQWDQWKRDFGEKVEKLRTRAHSSLAYGPGTELLLKIKDILLQRGEVEDGVEFSKKNAFLRLISCGPDEQRKNICLWRRGMLPDALTKRGKKLASSPELLGEMLGMLALHDSADDRKKMAVVLETIADQDLERRKKQLRQAAKPLRQQELDTLRQNEKMQAALGSGLAGLKDYFSRNMKEKISGEQSVVDKAKKELDVAETKAVEAGKELSLVQQKLGEATEKNEKKTLQKEMRKLNQRKSIAS